VFSLAEACMSYPLDAHRRTRGTVCWWNSPNCKRPGSLTWMRITTMARIVVNVGGHHARLSLTKLRDRLGDDFPVRKVREKLRCERCGDRRQIVVTFLAPNQRTGSLTHLFGQKPRQ
jgi:hypothetical protein